MSEINTNYETGEDKNILGKKSLMQYKIDKERQRYPFCIVWTPIPCISWLIPSIGHAGICNSEGIIHDFAAPYYVSIDNMAFGNPTKFAILELSQKEFYEYDKAIQTATIKYNKMDYNFFTNNCHSFIAYALNKLKYKGRNNYTMVDVWWMFCTRGKFLTFGDFVKTYSGFLFMIIFAFIMYKLFKSIII